MSDSERGASGEGVGEKEERIARILELQNTLHDLSQRVNSVKEENAKLRSENQVCVCERDCHCGKYGVTLMGQPALFRVLVCKMRERVCV